MNNKLCALLSQLQGYLDAGDITKSPGRVHYSGEGNCIIVMESYIHCSSDNL